MDQYTLDITGTDKHLWHGNKRLGRLNNVAEDTAQQIVQALNAWEEIKQAAENAHTKPPQDGAYEILEVVYNHIKGVIPKNVHPAGERFKESGEEGEYLPDNCTACGGSIYTCQCKW